VAVTHDGTTIRFLSTVRRRVSLSHFVEYGQHSFYLGRPVPGPETAYFKGQLDDVRIWNNRAQLRADQPTRNGELTAAKRAGRLLQIQSKDGEWRQYRRRRTHRRHGQWQQCYAEHFALSNGNTPATGLRPAAVVTGSMAPTTIIFRRSSQGEQRLHRGRRHHAEHDR